MKCQECGDDVDEIERVKIGSRTLKLCEECAEIKREEQEIGEAAESAVQGMMGYKGRWVVELATSKDGAKVTQRAVERFSTGRMLHDEGLLTTAGQRMVRGKIVVIKQQTGRKAHVWVRERGESLDALDEVFVAAKLDERNELLLVFNGDDWRARGWRLSPENIDAALGDGKRGLKENWAHGIVAALIALDLKAHDATEGPASREPLIVFGATMGGVGLLAGLAFLLRRRTRLAKARAEDSHGA